VPPGLTTDVLPLHHQEVNQKNEREQEATWFFALYQLSYGRIFTRPTGLEPATSTLAG
jgi:hypothetical protein